MSLWARAELSINMAADVDTTVWKMVFDHEKKTS